MFKLKLSFFISKQLSTINNMPHSSPYLLSQSLERAIMSILAGIDLFELDTQATRLTHSLKKRLIEARLDARDYELSETREEQLKDARDGRRKLEEVRKDILAASEYNIFSPVDVAQLTAQVELISEQLV